MYKGFFNDWSQNWSQGDKREMVNSKDNPPYKLAQLRPTDRNINKRFYIDFWVWDQNQNNGKGDLVRKQIKCPKNLKTVKEKESWASPIIADINALLVSGKHIRLEESTQDLKEDDHSYSVLQAFSKINEILAFQVKKDTAKDYRLAINHFSEWIRNNKLEQLPIKELSHQLIIQYLDEYQIDNQVNNITRNNRLRNLSAITSQMVKRGWLEESPFMKVGTLKEPKSQKHPFTEKHLAMLVPELTLHRHKQLWQACQFIYYLFVRPSELEHMKVHQIDFKNLNVMVPNTFKSGEVKHPDICPDLLEVMEQMNLRKAHPEWYVFGTEGVPGPLKRKKCYFTKKFADIRDKLELPHNYTFYCWKHTGNLHFLMNGGSLTAAMKQNGHQSLSTTEVYAKSIGYNFNMEIRTRQNGLLLKQALKTTSSTPSVDKQDI